MVAALAGRPDPEGEVLPVAEAKNVSVSSGPGRYRVVVVDDSPTILGLFELMVMPEDDPVFEIVGAAEDGIQGLETVLRLEPDLVILDYEMPGLDGLSLIRKIGESLPKTAVFLMSSHVEESAALESAALEAGALDFIPKPQKDYNSSAIRPLIELHLKKNGILPRK